MSLDYNECVQDTNTVYICGTTDNLFKTGVWPTVWKLMRWSGRGLSSCAMLKNAALEVEYRKYALPFPRKHGGTHKGMLLVCR